MNTIVDFRSYTTARGVPTVVFVDMQKEYLATPRLIAIPEIDDALANCRKLLAHARECGLPVAFVRWLDRATPFFNQATPFAGWIEGFEPQRNEMIFQRNRPSCYSSDGFAQFMDHGDKDVVLAGFAGEFRLSLDHGRGVSPRSPHDLSQGCFRQPPAVRNGR